MQEIKLANVVVGLSIEGNNIRIESSTENVILSNQTIGTVSDLIENNFNIVRNHYKKKIENVEANIDLNDINQISIKIVLHYLYIYNTWKNEYQNQEKRDLKFLEKDFANPSTHDIIFNYFKTKYLHEWEKKCAILLGMELNDLKAYYKTREDFYNK